MAQPPTTGHDSHTFLEIPIHLLCDNNKSNNSSNNSNNKCEAMVTVWSVLDRWLVQRIGNKMAIWIIKNKRCLNSVSVRMSMELRCAKSIKMESPISDISNAFKSIFRI
jgi:hypothetical protein